MPGRPHPGVEFFGWGRSNFSIPHRLTCERWRALMILTIFTGGATYHAPSDAVLRRLIGELVGDGSGRGPYMVGRPKGGILATFVLLAPHRDPMGSDRYFDSYLQVSVNPLTGYGALRWQVPEDSVVRVDREIARSVWISKNSEPPVLDQNVVADFDDWKLFEPRNTLPMSDIRAAVEEFCELRSGQRPTLICWNRGDFGVYRSLDGRAGVTDSYCQDPWCGDSGTRHPLH
ncbi:Imm1 family immunity protein [Streptomyces koyangensis]|uniref:Imm1 family immunity protein n=1 Tax=Streptomyces koyangensis TaxID=188770 RepID=UPI00384F76F2